MVAAEPNCFNANLEVSYDLLLFLQLYGFSVVNSPVSGLETVHKQSMIDSSITNGNSYCFNLTNTQPGAHLKEHLIRLPYFVIVTYIG